MDNDYGYFEVSFEGTDETHIVMGYSLESVKMDMEEIYGESLVEVKPISVEEVATDDDSFDPEVQHQNVVSILSGFNPFAKAKSFETNEQNLAAVSAAKLNAIMNDKLRPVQEKLSKSDDMGKWIDDFRKSDAPQFQGKSDEKKRQMAIAAKLSAEEAEETPKQKPQPQIIRSRKSMASVRRDSYASNPHTRKEDVELDEASIEAVKKAITAPSGTGRRAFGKSKEELKAKLKAMRDKIEPVKEANFFDMSPDQQKAFLKQKSTELQNKHKEYHKDIRPTLGRQTSDPNVIVRARNSANTGGKVTSGVGQNNFVKEDNLDEVSIDRAQKVKTRAINNMMKGVGGSEPNPDIPGTFKRVPPTEQDKETSEKGLKSAALANKTIGKAMNKKKTGRYEALDTVITSDMSIEEQEELINLLPRNLVDEALEALGLEEKRGLWDNIHAKRKRIKAGSGERMRKPGSEGAPSNDDFKNSRNEEYDSLSDLEEALYGDNKIKNKKVKLKPETDQDHTMRHLSKSSDANVVRKSQINGIGSDKMSIKNDPKSDPKRKGHMDRARFGNDNAQNDKKREKFKPTVGLGNPNSPVNRAAAKEKEQKAKNIAKLKALKAKVDARKGVKEEKTYDSGWKKPTLVKKDKFGNVVKDKNRAQHLAKQGMSQAKKDNEEKK